MDRSKERRWMVRVTPPKSESEKVPRARVLIKWAWLNEFEDVPGLMDLMRCRFGDVLAGFACF
jgi:hypothetical protein